MRWPEKPFGLTRPKAMRPTERCGSRKAPVNSLQANHIVVCGSFAGEPHPYLRRSLECRETDIGRTLCIELAFYGLAGPRC